MLSRREVLTGAGVLLAVSTSSRSAAAALSYEPLFRIERSKNANIVQYDALTTSAEELDRRTPVVAYWLMLAEDGRREGFNALDKRAYGFKVRPEAGGSWLLYLNATSDRALRVLRWQSRWVTQAVLRGRSAVLTRIFVGTDESGLIPRVRWVDLFGIDMINRQLLTERIHPR